MVAKEWRDARWKVLLAAVAVLAVVALAPRTYGAILDDIERQAQMARAELASPEEFMGLEEPWPPGYSPEEQEASLREEIEEMRRADYPVGMASVEVSGVHLGASFVLVPLAALLGVALVSGEVSRGTVFLLLSHPVSRTRILLTKYLLGAAAVFAVALLGGVGIVASGYVHGYPAASLDAARILAQSGLFWLGTLSVLGVATLASVLFQDVVRSVVATVAALYAINSLPDWARGVASFWVAPSESVSFEDQMAEQAWYESFEAFKLINYWILPEPLEGPIAVYQPGPVLSVFVCFVAAVLPLLAALWLFQRKSY